MKKSKFEQIINNYLRKGLVGRADYLRKLDSLILPIHKKMIQENDRSVLRELILPKWMEWDVLVAWANKDIEEHSRCLFCNRPAEYEYKGQNICSKCISALKKIVERKK